jgi:hypothetical protein
LRRSAAWSAAAALIRHAECDQIGSHFAQKVLRQGTRATLREALQFEQVFRYAAHFESPEADAF